MSKIYWCNTHNREATHTKENGQPCCDPKLGGIAISCHDIVEKWTIKVQNETVASGSQKFRIFFE